MGAYVNPTEGTKESWLEAHGTPTIMPVRWENVPEGHLPVILVLNPNFSAAGICYCEKELHAFQEPHDLRPKRAYFVPIEKLHTVSGELKLYMGHA